MHKLALAFAAGVTLLGMPASAAYFPTGWNTTDKVTLDKDQVGLNFVIDYQGKASDDYTSKLSALGNFTYTGVTNAGKTFNFNYSITNDSQYDSRIRSFGFDVDPNVTNNSVGAVGISGFTRDYLNQSYIEGVGTMDVCFAAGSDGCTAHGTGGINDGSTLNGSFSLTFASVMEELDFDHFAMKFVSVNPSVNGQNYGAGLGTLVSITPPPGAPIVAPEPGTWLMMLGGFGMVGGALRRRKRYDFAAVATA